MFRFSKVPGIYSGSNNNLWYSFDYSLVHFVILSSEHSYTPDSEQVCLNVFQLLIQKA